jgi:hypothetical protein
VIGRASRGDETPRHAQHDRAVAPRTDSPAHRARRGRNATHVAVADLAQARGDDEAQGRRRLSSARELGSSPWSVRSDKRRRFSRPAASSTKLLLRVAIAQGSTPRGTAPRSIVNPRGARRWSVGRLASCQRQLGRSPPRNTTRTRKRIGKLRGASGPRYGW